MTAELRRSEMDYERSADPDGHGRRRDGGQCFVAGVVYADPEAPHERKLGGQCAYAEHPGTCTNLSVEKTPESTAQASLSGGPGYEGLAVTLSSWYRGPRFLERYGIAAGKSFECTLKVITQGTCTPTIIDFPHIDRTDYFESQALSK